MSFWKLAKQSLFFYWRTNLGVLLSVIVSTAVLTGALIIGDSVRYTLMKMVDTRLGATQFALVPQQRFFSMELSNELSKELDTLAASVLQLRGMITDGNDVKRVNRVEVIGVDEQFYRIAGVESPFQNKWNEIIILNEPLAGRLGVKVNDEVVLRIEKPSLMSRDIVLTPDSDLSTAFRLKVGAIAGESQFGRFSLQANQVSPMNVFVPMKWLQEKVGRNGQSNIILVAENEKNNITIDSADEAIKKIWQLADAELEVKQLDRQDVFEIRSRRVFIDDFLSKAALDADNESIGILTYFVNELRLDDKATPYSIVSAIEPSEGENKIIPVDMQNDEIIINQWLADDLEAQAGDIVSLAYYVQMPMRKLEEQSKSFRIRKILPMEGSAIDSDLMPDFPGLADVNNCRDWDTGIDIDLDKIRDKDEAYWDNYRGTPKAFITLSAGQQMWANRYGNLTAVRYPLNDNSEEVISRKILDVVDPASVGLFFMPVRELGTTAGGGTTDFSQLFLGLSMFLIVAALILTGLVFVFGIESRSEQIGILKAVGFSPKVVKRLLLVEGCLLAIMGALAGTVVAVLYTKIMIYALGTIWQSVVSGSSILFHTKISTLFMGFSGAVIFSMVAIWVTLRRHLSRPAHELLAGALRWQYFKAKSISKGRIGLGVAVAGLIGAVVLLAVVGAGDSSAVSGAFFGAGALLLIAGLGLCQALLKIIAGRWNRAVSSLAGLGLRNSTRRGGRSLAVVGLLACGIFLVIAVGANKKSPADQALRRDSGTGGFDLYGESTIGILHDLNDISGRKSLGLDERDFEGVQIVQLRVHDGDDASCLNLNRAQMPRLLGVQPEKFQERGSFGFRDIIEGADKQQAWELLNRPLGENVVPAIGDYATVFWALGKSVGDELEYTDEKGRKFQLKIVGILNNSIMQGSLLISENEFIERFPSDEGYRVLLIDTAGVNLEKLSDTLSFRLQMYGLELMPTTQRLAQFMAVENTYLSIFQSLGGLGLILGSIGLGLVVLRNVLERRGELAMLQAVGFTKGTLKKMLLHEHGGLMLYGLACGVIAALVAVGPVLRTTTAHIPYITVIAIGVSCIIWIWIATTIALSGEMLDALRNE